MKEQSLRKLTIKESEMAGPCDPLKHRAVFLPDVKRCIETEIQGR